jgi:hypothetical protein
MTYNEVKLIAELVSIGAGLTGRWFVKRIEKELIALVWRKMNSLWQLGPKQGD